MDADTDSSKEEEKDFAYYLRLAGVIPRTRTRSAIEVETTANRPDNSNSIADDQESQVYFTESQVAVICNKYFDKMERLTKAPRRNFDTDGANNVTLPSDLTPPNSLEGAGNNAQANLREEEEVEIVCVDDPQKNIAEGNARNGSVAEHEEREETDNVHSDDISLEDGEFNDDPDMDQDAELVSATVLSPPAEDDGIVDYEGFQHTIPSSEDSFIGDSEVISEILAEAYTATVISDPPNSTKEIDAATIDTAQKEVINAETVAAVREVSTQKANLELEKALTTIEDEELYIVEVDCAEASDEDELPEETKSSTRTRPVEQKELLAALTSISMDTESSTVEESARIVLHYETEAFTTPVSDTSTVNQEQRNNFDPSSTLTNTTNGLTTRTISVTEKDSTTAESTIYCNVVSPSCTVPCKLSPPEPTVLCELPAPESTVPCELPPPESTVFCELPPPECAVSCELPPPQSAIRGEIPPPESTIPRELPSPESAVPCELLPSESTVPCQLLSSESVAPFDLPPPESAAAPCELPPPEYTAAPFELSPPESTAILGELPSPESTPILGELPSPESTAILGELPSPESTAILGELPAPESAVPCELPPLVSTVPSELSPPEPTVPCELPPPVSTVPSELSPPEPTVPCELPIPESAVPCDLPLPESTVSVGLGSLASDNLNLTLHSQPSQTNGETLNVSEHEKDEENLPILRIRSDIFEDISPPPSEAGDEPTCPFIFHPSSAHASAAPQIEPPEMTPGTSYTASYTLEPQTAPPLPFAVTSSPQSEPPPPYVAPSTLTLQAISPPVPVSQPPSAPSTTAFRLEQHQIETPQPVPPPPPQPCQQAVPQTHLADAREAVSEIARLFQGGIQTMETLCRGTPGDWEIFKRVLQHPNRDENPQRAYALLIQRLNNLRSSSYKTFVAIEWNMLQLRRKFPNLTTFGTVMGNPAMFGGDLTVEELVDYFEILVELMALYRTSKNPNVTNIVLTSITRLQAILYYYMYYKDPALSEQKFNTVQVKLMTKPMLIGQHNLNLVITNLWSSIRTHGGQATPEAAMSDHVAFGIEGFKARLIKLKALEAREQHVLPQQARGNTCVPQQPNIPTFPQASQPPFSQVTQANRPQTQPVHQERPRISPHAVQQQPRSSSHTTSPVVEQLLRTSPNILRKQHNPPQQQQPRSFISIQRQLIMEKLRHQQGNQQMRMPPPRRPSSGQRNHHQQQTLRQQTSSGSSYLQHQSSPTILHQQYQQSPQQLSAVPQQVQQQYQQSIPSAESQFRQPTSVVHHKCGSTGVATSRTPPMSQFTTQQQQFAAASQGQSSGHQAQPVSQPTLLYNQLNQPPQTTQQVNYVTNPQLRSQPAQTNHHQYAQQQLGSQLLVQQAQRSQQQQQVLRQQTQPAPQQHGGLQSSLQQTNLQYQMPVQNVREEYQAQQSSSNSTSQQVDPGTWQTQTPNYYSSMQYGTVQPQHFSYGTTGHSQQQTSALNHQSQVQAMQTSHLSTSGDKFGAQMGQAYGTDDDNDDIQVLAIFNEAGASHRLRQSTNQGGF